MFASAHENRRVQLWQDDGSLLVTLPPVTSEIRSLTISDDQQLVIVSEDQVMSWSVPTLTNTQSVLGYACQWIQSQSLDTSLDALPIPPTCR